MSAAAETLRSLHALATRNRELWWQFAVRAVEARHRGSHLGFLWALLNPLLMLTLYMVVFGFIFNSRFHVLSSETAVDYALAMFAGLVLFHVTAETLAAAPSFIVANPNLVKKVVFPLEVLPLANVSALWFHALISLGLLVTAALGLGRITALGGFLWMPLILAPLVLWTCGLGLMFAALGVFFRDITQVMGVATQVLLYASAVFYSPQTVQSVPYLWHVLKWNPLLETIDLLRRALLWNLPLDPNALLYTWVAGVGTLWLGAWLFKKTQSGFADVI
ncbi:ABC transporter permease [Nibricoccus sp. IMCC34717]|uniref:ABC transporter permease n=1 Tax=Nibricoccus sp. IMCC34717 TaxID=3034021 RepID=UPI00385088ED